jgi:tetratricopeptide (TPR) repeat protein
MKKFVCIYLSVLINVAATTVYAQEDAPARQLMTAVTALDNARSAEELQEARNLFQRIHTVYPDDWASCYYQAYINITLFFMNKAPDVKQKLIEEAEANIDKLKRLKNVSTEARSEISTLNGYYYYALMSADPQTNGPKYTGNVISSYAEALKLNPQNPRAILLNAYFQRNLSSFTGSTYTAFESDKAKAKELHEQEDKSSIMPHWWVEIR